MSAERKHREEIVRYGRMLHERGFVAAMDGNLSVRLDRRADSGDAHLREQRRDASRRTW